MVGTLPTCTQVNEHISNNLYKNTMTVIDCKIEKGKSEKNKANCNWYISKVNF